MTAPEALAVLALACLFAGLVLMRLRRADRAVMQVARLSFGGAIDAGQVRAVLAAVAGMPQRTDLTLEVVGNATGIRHFVRGEREAVEALRVSLSGLLPDCQLEMDGEEAAGRSFSHGRQFWFRGYRQHLLLRSDQAEQFSAGLLAVLAAPEGRHERICLRISLRPEALRRLPAGESGRDDAKWLMQMAQMSAPPVAGAQQTALAKKYGARTLQVAVTAMTDGGSDARASQLLEQVAAQLRSREGTLGQLAQRRMSAQQLRGAIDGSWRGQTSSLSIEEAVGLIAWPIGAPRIDGLQLGTTPRISPPAGWPTRGRVIGVSNVPRQRGRTIGQRAEAALTHTAIVGPTGSGKSALAINLILQDARRGHGALVVDLKGDLVDDLLARLPAARCDDVIVCDPASTLPQPTLDLFPNGAEAGLTADLLLGTFREMFGEASWGVRSEQYLHLGLLTLAHLPHPALTALPQLFADQRLRGVALARANDPWLASAWQRFDALSKAEQAQHLAAPMAKLEQLLGRKPLRRVLGTGDGTLDFARALREQKIVLVRLPQGQIGRPAARLLTSLLLWQFFAAVSGRAALSERARRPYFAYLDEAAALGRLPLPLDHLLEQARGFGVGLTLLPQALSQLPVDLRQSLMANVGSVIAYRQQSLDEAKLVAKLLPRIDPEQLQQLERFTAVMRLSNGVGASAPVMTGTTLPPPPPNQSAGEVRVAAARRLGDARPLADEGAAAEYDLNQSENELPGQRRRQS